MNENQTKPTYIMFDCPHCGIDDIKVEFINVDFKTDFIGDGACVECPYCEEEVELNLV